MNSADGGIRFRRARRRRQMRSVAAARRATTPPTTPPAMAPVLVRAARRSWEPDWNSPDSDGVEIIEDDPMDAVAPDE